MLFFALLVFLPISSESALLHAQYDFDWKIEGDFVVFEVQARTRGWVGLGLNEKPLMKDACIVVAGVKNGQGYAYDTHGIGETRPIPDERQNYELLTGSENETHTSLTIRRRLDTGDPFDTTVDTDPVYILWAFGETDARNITSFDYHSHRGYTQFTLVTSQNPNRGGPVAPSLNDPAPPLPSAL